MTDLNCYVTTFNCGRTPINVDYFAANLFNGLKTNIPPDLVVLALEEIAPIGYSFLGGSLLAPYFTRFTTAVNVAASKQFGAESDYVTVLVRNVGMTAIMVFARSSIEERIRWIETAGVGVGVWEMGNKGAVGSRIGLGLGLEDDEMALTFVAAHLAPMEDAWERRNADWKSICEGLVFERDGSVGTLRKAKSNGGPEAEPLLSSEDGTAGKQSEQHSLFSPISQIFFAGDLNYRASDTSPKLDDYKNWPQPVESVSDVHHYSHMLERDQLTRELRKNNTLHHLAEPEITFPPTYKYSNLAQRQAASAGTTKASEDRAWLWARHRVPSWCDRILSLASAPPTVHSYTALSVQPTSDHRPVAMSFSIPFKAMAQIAHGVKPPFPTRKDWREARATARQYEFIVGIAAYLTLTWEGEALLGGTVVGILGGYLALRALIGT